MISGIELQGRFGNGEGKEFTEQYRLEYWRDGFNRWRRYKDKDKYEVSRG